MAINTACSSSLVAAHTACQSLRQNECDTAIAAGVNLLVSPEAYIGMTQAGMLSPDGKSHAFDRRANGMVQGEAVAVGVLKRSSRALGDGDPRSEEQNTDIQSINHTSCAGLCHIKK